MRRRPRVEYQPFYPLVREQYGENPPAFVGAINFFNALLIINKPQPLSDIFINKSMYVDKEEMIKMQFKPFLGESSLLIKASEEQVRMRKLIGSAFYKDKLLKMVEVIKDLVASKVEKFENLYLKG